uniref:Uncharacterized protein n=1 Tax=Oryza brachyantha TaxID=4533 RepID=J3MLT6_ORYBR
CSNLLKSQLELITYTPFFWRTSGIIKRHFETESHNASGGSAAADTCTSSEASEKLQRISFASPDLCTERLSSRHGQASEPHTLEHPPTPDQLQDLPAGPPS